MITSRISRLVQNFIGIRLRAFGPTRAKLYIKYLVGYFFNFWDSSHSLPPRPLHRLWRSVYITRRRFLHECVFWGSWKQNYTFGPIFFKKNRNLYQFLAELKKFRFKRSFNIEDFASKRPNKCIWKLDTEEANQLRHKNQNIGLISSPEVNDLLLMLCCYEQRCTTFHEKKMWAKAAVNSCRSQFVYSKLPHTVQNSITIVKLIT